MEVRDFGPAADDVRLANDELSDEIVYLFWPKYCLGIVVFIFGGTNVSLAVLNREIRAVLQKGSLAVL